ncbi:lipopolysaccharide biosynthesis protein [Geomonas sp. RF6]|uniref:lipopolysaccharide biosynthesis protein n=1 Tax=Geomonas sp. RF6 TaxID=2897342 RepID=UPI001E5AC0C9|nr:lipopolysaccharide biosynthesis protein [Geomonas sp. RF6]UFS69110.1 lipopolysaccharide biosynthesis protein [Geomonas sp. RF6]
MSLRRTTALGIGYNALIRVMMFGCQGVTSIILARSLKPSDYGIVGFSLIFVNFFRSFSDMGLNNALVKNKTLDDLEAGTAFVLRIILGMTACLVAYLVSIPAGWLFSSPQVVPAIRALSVNFLISAFALLPVAFLKRELNYRRLSIYELSITVVSSVASIVAALLGYGFWSIVAGNLLATALSTVLVNLLRPTRILLAFDRKIARIFLSYGSHIFVSGLVVYLMLNTDNFIVGAASGTALLGCYTIAFNWGSMVCTILQGVVLNVLFPTFSRLVREGKKIEKQYLDVVEYVAFLAVATNLTLFIASHDFLLYFLGKGDPKWLPALPALRILCLYGIIRAILEPMGQVMLALGKSELISRATLIAAVVEIVAIYPALKIGGLVGAAVVVTVAYVLQYFYYLRVLAGIVDLKASAIGRRVLPALLAAPAACVGLFGPGTASPGLVGLFVKVILAVLCYLVAYGLLTRWKFYREMRTLIPAPAR